jgi:SAM-dependent methyltransferase
MNYLQNLIKKASLALHSSGVKGLLRKIYNFLIFKIIYRYIIKRFIIKKIFNFFNHSISNSILLYITNFRDLKEIKKQYGNFERLNKVEQKKYALKLPNICGFYYAEIVKTIINLNISPKRILLDCDSKLVKKLFKEKFNLNSAEIFTVGIGNDFDLDWDFECDPPENLPHDFDLIISQNIFEHLINPYKHFSDLADRLGYGGVIIIQTHMPGFYYHRYPIDTLRFYPDWFETSANRLKLNILNKIQRGFNIFYIFTKSGP